MFVFSLNNGQKKSLYQVFVGSQFFICIMAHQFADIIRLSFANMLFRNQMPANPPCFPEVMLNLQLIEDPLLLQFTAAFYTVGVKAYFFCIRIFSGYKEVCRHYKPTAILIDRMIDTELVSNGTCFITVQRVLFSNINVSIIPEENVKEPHF